MAASQEAHSEEFAVAVSDARRAMAYLIAPESDDYLAIMTVLESSVSELTPGEVLAALQAAGVSLDQRVVEKRLDQLRDWTAVSARTDASRILRHADLLARNWRYTATPVGRQVHRFYRQYLDGTPAVREIPLPSLARIVTVLTWLGQHPDAGGQDVAEHVGQLFTSHDDLDGALVGAEDALAGLADRFDLDTDATGELKEMLVNYATRIAAELERGAAQASRALHELRPRFAELAESAVAGSEARALIERGALAASRGGRVEDWEALTAWFDPDTGRAAQFALRLIRALPGMHANLRRLHTSAGTATSRARALSLARACRDERYGTAILLAALGDHPWRKLHGAADDDDLTRNPGWRAGPDIAVPALLRATGRSGPRGRAAAARDDTEARAHVARERERRRAEHSEALREVLATPPGGQLSERAARVAFAALLAAVRSNASHDRRVATRDGLGCTLWHVGSGATGMLLAPTWRVWVPGRISVFHLPGTAPPRPLTPTRPDDGKAVELVLEGAA